MFKKFKTQDELLQKFRAGAEYINRRLLNRGHTPKIDSEIERFEREVVEPLDKAFAK